MHEHASLRRALEKKEQNKFCSHQQNRFKKDPMKFGKSLFEKKTSGEPSFGKNQCFDYFSRLYRDEERSDHVFPMPEMTPVPPPKFLFFEKAPSEKEIF